MRVFKSSFLRLFTTGFVAGAIAVVTLQPSQAHPAGEVSQSAMEAR